jgi:hypothetical protein
MITRRNLLKLGAAITLGTGFGAATNPYAARAKAVVQIWLSGGPSHLDTFDPKPEAGEAYCGPLKTPIKTKSGFYVSEYLPELAKCSDKYSLLRSMTHGQNGHETAAYFTQTGRIPGGRLSYPSVGAVITYLKGQVKSQLPNYIAITQTQGRFSDCGFLGMKYKPFATGGDPNSGGKFAVEGIVAPGISDSEQEHRRSLLNESDMLGKVLKNDSQIEEAEKARKEAYDLIIGDAGKVFDLSQEKDEIRQKYGRHTFGQSCLAAKRLIEKGVKYITINFWGWDTHKENFLNVRRLAGQMDTGVASLINDLASLGLLESTIVWCGGEFGRTPKIQMESPWNNGRNHFGAVFSHLIAGGGFKGGQVVGESNSKGEEVKTRPIYPRDLIGSIYAQMGIDPGGSILHPMSNEQIPLLEDFANVKLLREIMT